MSDMPVNPNNMIETSDSLEAVAVFRTWKSIFFAIVLICLVLVQAAFWAVDLRLIKAAGTPAATTPEATTTSVESATADEASAGGLLGKLDYERVARITGVANGILIVSAILFAMTVFFCLMVSLVGRLGGINHISRAFILSLIMVALIIPWQELFESYVVGVVYGPGAIEDGLVYKAEGVPNLVFYYLRFCGLWFVALLLLIMTQIRSSRWSKSIIRRLEII
ncbi:MAG TPA: hypothetical protein PKH24_10730 [Sedimentisphaerales bacterium]|jgi:hypothetical protein|nr:hypothetical protein [Sedimentisphaerales bacterium]HNU31725.1 hypothetical protein [Sedimentisphaerales bacterium]